MLVKDSVLLLDDELEIAMDEVNIRVNKREYESDMSRFNKRDFWDASGGDCEDYSLEKRNQLADLGVPMESMGIACCWTEDKVYHAVLLVHTDKGAYCLDNRTGWVQPWEDLPYKWDKAFDGVDKVWRKME